jgi:hypothetical protein
MISKFDSKPIRNIKRSAIDREVDSKKFAETSARSLSKQTESELSLNLEFEGIDDKKH